MGHATVSRSAYDREHERELRKHDMDTLTRSQTLALARVIGALEGVISSGIIKGSDTELDLRIIVAEACAAFNLPSKPEIGGGVQ